MGTGTRLIIERERERATPGQAVGPELGQPAYLFNASANRTRLPGEEGLSATDPTRSTLAHDQHFLERTVRFAGPEMERAMRLYHHSKVVKRLVPEQLKSQPCHDRAAIALSETSPSAHVIVSREGNFITCLTPQMRVGEVPIIPYEVLRVGMDQSDAGQESARVRRKQLEQLSAKTLIRDLLKGPGHLTRETVEIVERNPLTYLVPIHVAFCHVLKMELRSSKADLGERKNLRWARRLDGLTRMCLYLFSAMDTKVITTILVTYLRVSTKLAPELATALARHQDGGERLFEIGTDESVPARCRHWAIYALLYHGIHYPEHVSSLAQRLKESTAFDRSWIWAKFWDHADAIIAATKEQVVERAGKIVASLTPLKEPGSDATWILGQQELHQHVMRQSPLSALFPPRASSRQVKEAWQRYLHAPPPEKPKGPKSKPLVRATPRVGRNEPCPCNSGRKYKSCCLGQPAPAPAAAAASTEAAPTNQQ